jgi:hypothetical protein
VIELHFLIFFKKLQRFLPEIKLAKEKIKDHRAKIEEEIKEIEFK